MVGRQSRLFVGSPGPPEDEFKKKKKNDFSHKKMFPTVFRLCVSPTAIRPRNGGSKSEIPDGGQIGSDGFSLCIDFPLGLSWAGSPCSSEDVMA